MQLAHLVFSITFTVYILIALAFEERDLIYTFLNSIDTSMISVISSFYFTAHADERVKLAVGSFT